MVTPGVKVRMSVMLLSMSHLDKSKTNNIDVTEKLDY